MWRLLWIGVFLGNIEYMELGVWRGVVVLEGVCRGVVIGLGVWIFFFLGVILEKLFGCNFGFFFLNSGVWVVCIWVRFCRIKNEYI